MKKYFKTMVKQLHNQRYIYKDIIKFIYLHEEFYIPTTTKYIQIFIIKNIY